MSEARLLRVAAVSASLHRAHGGVGYGVRDPATIAGAAIRINAVMYDGIWDGMYMLLLSAFAIGNACYGTALLSLHGLARVVGGFMLAACVLTICLFINELGISLLPSPVRLSRT